MVTFFYALFSIFKRPLLAHSPSPDVSWEKEIFFKAYLEEFTDTQKC